MFEFSVLRKYLIPRKRHLSVSLIGLMSIFVITAVVWLILVFLSVTSGIEKTWLSKLTQLNAPLQIQLKPEYYSSYYYLIDSYAFESSYTPKTIREKLLSTKLDPYDPEIDHALPKFFPQKEGTDLIKDLLSVIDNQKKQFSNLYYSDYETAPTLLKIKLFRPMEGFNNRLFSQNFITQAAYIATLCQSNQQFKDLLLSPSCNDITHMLSKIDCTVGHILTDAKSTIEQKSVDLPYLQSILIHANIETLIVRPGVRLYLADIEEGSYFYGKIIDQEIYLSTSKEKQDKFTIKNRQLYLDKSLVEGISTVNLPSNYEFSYKGYELSGEIKGSCKNKESNILVTLPSKKWIVKKANPTVFFSSKPEIEPSWVYFANGKVTLPSSFISPVLLPKNYRESDVLIGDVGYLSYGTFSMSSSLEQRQAITVAGFYDPGILAVGSRSILADYDLVHTLSSSSYAQATDPLLTNGIQIWTGDIKDVQKLQKNLSFALKEKNLDRYFSVISFYEYPFSKDLMQQFQSDRYLFMIIGYIILAVACSNIIALLLMLIRDKRKEIGIMQAMGASKASIAWIFGALGASLGLISCVFGTLLASLTLSNIDHIVHFLSMLQGREAFNPIFYGNHLPSTISMQALMFLFVLTPLLSIIASLIPAFFAMRISPTEILKSES